MATDDPTISKAEDLPAQLGGSCIVQIHGGNIGRCFQVEGELAVGRSDSNDVVVNQPDVSRKHLRIYKKGLASFVHDLGSTNGTYLNDTKLTAEMPLRSGDLIKLGPVVFKYLDGGDVETLYHEEIYRMTITDGLTRLHNKRYFHEFLTREMARSLRHRRPLCLAMFDIDDFKAVNDTHGHVAGDHLLTAIAEAVTAETRRENLFARYGGDEFALVMTEMDLDSAILYCEKLRHRISELRLSEGGDDVKATVSAGVVSMNRPLKPSEMIQLADQALYEAKQAGGDRVVVAEAGG